MEDIFLGISSEGSRVVAYPEMLNRHGLIAGATGTGKTVTLQVLAEQFSKIGTSVFLTDVKGDLSGLAGVGKSSAKLEERLQKFPDLEFSHSSFPVNFMDMFGERGHPLRVTPLTLGPLILSRLLDLNETQEGVLHIAFRFADEQGLLLLDLKDLQSLLRSMGDHLSEIKLAYGNVTTASIGSIQRRLMVLEGEGAERFFGEPEFRVRDLLVKDFSGRGLIHILDSTRLFRSPRLYGSILLWLLSELFEQLDEVGDLPVPRLALFFDEAHLLFNNLPPSLSEKIEMVVRLIRSKGVSVFFVTQSPDDVPSGILGQLGNRVQHALRSYTPQDGEKIRKTARTFRSRAGLSVEEVITNLSVGEALVSILSKSGEPTEVERTLIRPPESLIGPISEDEHRRIRESSPLLAKYSEMIDRESAYEVLLKRAEEASSKVSDEIKTNPRSTGKKSENSRSKTGPVQAFFTSLARSVGSQVGRQIFRGILGTLTKK
ncbi:MAG TPA: DUF853 family protein [Oligoflexia bacterium]|nr:DUF853 family protein [Oligoflexia bacterium]HMP49482.1 DUF853 family protein [Oligoflexia bacterium]